MLGIRLFGRSEIANYFDDEITCFGLLLELHEYKHFCITLCLYEIRAFSRDKSLNFCFSKTKQKQNKKKYCSEFISQPELQGEVIRA